MPLGNIRKMLSEVRCPICGKTFKTGAELTEHAKEHERAKSTATALTQIEETNTEIENCKARLQKLATLYADGKISEQSYLVTVKSIEKRLEALNKIKDNPNADFPANESGFDFHKDEELKTQKTKPSERPLAIWYVAPLLLGLIGGLIGYVILKDENPEMANNILYFGIIMLFVNILAIWAIYTWWLSLIF